MRITFLAFSALILVSCGTTKSGQVNSTTSSTVNGPQTETALSKPVVETEAESEVAYILMQGTVHLNKNGCEQLIEMDLGGDSKLVLYPVNLEKQFQKEGLNVSFTYKKIQVQRPEGCQADFTVRLISISE